MPARLDSLTGLRFAAALFVVVHHLMANDLAYVGPADRLASVGYVGVEFFFVLSGFVLTWALRPGDRARSFFRRRFARVYPLHIAFLIPGAVLLASGLIDVSATSIALTVPLLQAWSPGDTVVDQSLNQPDWSLSCEAFFYLCFPLLGALLARQASRRLFAVAGGVVAAMVCIYLVSRLPSLVEDTWWLVYTHPAYRMGEFVLGILLALLVSRGTVRLPSLRTACLLAAGALFAVAWIGDVRLNRGLTGLLLLPFCLLLIGAAAQADLSRAASPFRGRRWVKLGVWSFALYLAHFPIIMIVQEIWPAGVDATSRPVGALVTLALVLLAIAVAGVAHSLIEAPLERRLRGTRRPSAIQSQDADTALAVKPGPIGAPVTGEADA